MKCHCGKVFTHRSSLLRHMRESCTLRNVNPQPIKRKGDDLTADNTLHLKKRMKNVAARKILECPDCPHDEENRSDFTQRINNIELINSAFKCRIATYRISTSKHHINHETFFQDVSLDVLTILSKHRRESQSVKFNLTLFATYIIPQKEMSDLKHFNTKNRIITEADDLNQLYLDSQKDITSKADKMQEKNSGWALQRIMYLEVNINKYNPLRACGYIPLPKQIRDKKAIINITNSDNKCFAYAVMAALYPVNKNPQSPTLYQDYPAHLNFNGLEFPIKLVNINKFEVLNDISVNVFGLKTRFIDGKTSCDIVGPLHLTKRLRDRHVNLLYLSDDNGNSHYCLIKNLSRLVSKQISNHDHRLYICNGCLQFFRNPEHLRLHEQNDCTFVCAKLPSKEHKINKLGELLPQNILKFVNIEKQLAVPFIVYADFESLLKPIQHNEPQNDRSFTVQTFEHVPYSFCFYIKCNFDDSLSKLEHYRGLDAPEKFIELLEKYVVNIYRSHLREIKPILPLTSQQHTEFENATLCYICDKPFNVNDVKVHDHNHESGLYRGVCHSVCNLHYKTPKFLPVVFHNLTNYDCHLFIKKLALNKERVDVIGQNKEKYITFGKHICVEKGVEGKDNVYIKLRFIDSLRFLPASLDKLSQTLTDNQCCEIKRYFTNVEQFNQIRKKGVFPYSYIDSIEKLLETEFPPHHTFYDVLRGESVSEEDYRRGKYVWDLFKCKTLGDYSDIYIKSDVLLLADVFENFREVCLRTYKLDPAQYITAPSLSWDAMLRHTNIELELLTDIDMVHFFRKGIRGGISQCSKREAIANNKLVPDYDKTKPTSYIMYLDATNLYGYAMSQILPHSGFKWLTSEEIEELDITEVSDDSQTGYVLEVDLEYPEEIHNLHNDLPFCPENKASPIGKHSKLLLTLCNKSHYIIHYRSLKQCLAHGLILKKVYRVLEFKQSAWLKTYIELNTKLRNSAKNAFERDLFKFMVNSIFGKTMENVEKRQDIKLKSHWESRPGSVGAEVLISRPNFKSCSVFSEDLVAIQMSPLEVVYDKPLYVGFSILDISKTKMYSFYYDFLKTQYGENAMLCYTDTDSLILEIHTDNVYNDIKSNIEWFDTSNYDINNIYGIPKTLSEVGKMKDEYAGKVVHSFYGTGAKAYFVGLEDSQTKKAKGISKNIINKELSLMDYKYIVENGGVIYKKMYIFKSNLHTMYTELKNKVALSSFDDKRCIVEGDVKTLAWGHYSLKTPEEKLDLLLTLANKCIENDSNDSTFYINNFDVQLL